MTHPDEVSEEELCLQTVWWSDLHFFLTCLILQKKAPQAKCVRLRVSVTLSASQMGGQATTSRQQTLRPNFHI